MKSIISRFRVFRNTATDFLLNSRLFWSVILLLVVLFTFALGRLSKIFEEKPGFIITESTLDLNSDGGDNTKRQETKTIVSTKGSKKYYFIWCKAVDNLRDKNKIYFDSEDLAKQAGLTLAGSCK